MAIAPVNKFITIAVPVAGVSVAIVPSGSTTAMSCSSFRVCADNLNRDYAS